MMKYEDSFSRRSVLKRLFEYVSLFVMDKDLARINIFDSSYSELLKCDKYVSLDLIVSKEDEKLVFKKKIDFNFRCLNCAYKNDEVKLSFLELVFGILPKMCIDNDISRSLIPNHSKKEGKNFVQMGCYRSCILPNYKDHKDYWNGQIIEFIKEM